MAPIMWVNVPMLPPDACQASNQEGSGMKTTAGALNLMPGRILRLRLVLLQVAAAATACQACCLQQACHLAFLVLVFLVLQSAVMLDAQARLGRLLSGTSQSGSMPGIQQACHLVFLVLVFLVLQSAL